MQADVEATARSLSLTTQIGPVVAVFAIGVLRVLALWLGYRIVRMGYDALVAGVQGKFDFGGRVHKDLEFKLVSTSPGLLFVVLGVALMAWALYAQAHVTIPGFSVSVGSGQDTKVVMDKPPYD